MSTLAAGTNNPPPANPGFSLGGISLNPEGDGLVIGVRWAICWRG